MTATTRPPLPAIVTSLALTAVLAAVTASLEATCVGFEEPSSSTAFTVGSTFTDTGVTIELRAFQWGDGTWTSAGLATVSTAGDAGHLGQELTLDNITAEPLLDDTVGAVSFAFGEYGGTLNLSVNGDFRNVENFADVHGATIGGCSVSVIAGLGNDAGLVWIEGPVSSLTVGGQELAIDRLCFHEDCDRLVDLEYLPVGATLMVGDSLTQDGVTVTGAPFQWDSGVWTSAGEARVDNAGQAGRTGLDMSLDNITLMFDAGATITTARIWYHDAGGSVNLDVDGDHRSALDFIDVLSPVGGGSYWAVQGPDGYGVIELEGTFATVALGGQELWIDDVCLLISGLFADGFEGGSSDRWSSTSP